MKAADYRERARQTLSGRWGTAVLVCFLGMLLGGVTSVDLADVTYTNNGWMLKIFNFYQIDLSFVRSNETLGAIVAALTGVIAAYSLIRFFIGGAVELGICRYFTKSARNMETSVSDEFSCFEIFFKALGLRILMAIFITLWMLLLIVPGIIAAYKYCLAPYIMAENPNIGVMEAINLSKEMMDGYKWNKFCLDLSFIGWAILCLLTCGIGLLFLNPYTQMATAHFYCQRRMENGSQANGTTIEWQ